MSKFLLGILIFLYLIFSPSITFAQNSLPSFVNIIMPIRGGDFWPDQNVSPSQSFSKFFDLLNSKGLPATWLLRFDALKDKDINSKLKSDLEKNEVGLFLEITPAIAEESGVKYHSSRNWHQAESALLTGYIPDERKKIIDAYFEKFKKEFGYYPKAVGAWWIDAYSLAYMHQKYQIKVNLAVADQFSTDGYQVWGQYWSTPFYPSKFNASQVAQSTDNKIGVVQLQWAARDPYNGYGGRVEDSTFSVQANDYTLHPSLTTAYFSKLLDVYLKDNNLPFSQITVGIENNFTRQNYFEEFKRQLEDIVAREQRGEVQIVTMDQFANWYSNQFPLLSPAKLIVSKNPLNDKQNVVWYSNLGYRAGLFTNRQGLVLRDLRLYSDTMEEPCLKVSCQNLDLARTTSKPIDDVTYRQSLSLEEGEIVAFKVSEKKGQVQVEYKNILGKEGNIIFDKNDIYINGKPSTIAGLIIDTTTKTPKQADQTVEASPWPKFDLFFSVKSISIFLLSVLILFISPGKFILRRLIKTLDFYEELILSTILGIGVFLALSYFGKLIQMEWMAWIGIGIVSILGFKEKISKPYFKLSCLPPLLAIIFGVLISVLPVIKSGLLYPYGMGFWGPNGHDAIWHLSLIESLKKSLPPENYLFSGTYLNNYHYFFDLILSKLSQIPVLESLGLYFRLWPVFLSILLGAAIWIFCNKLNFKSITTTFVILFTFTAGSWGWIISYFRQGDFGGESMFWANQAISLHLNPPFALSLVFLLGGLLFLIYSGSKNNLWIISSFLFGILWGVKAYAGLILLGSLGILAIYHYLKSRNLTVLKMFLLTLIISLIFFLPIYSKSTNLFEFSPFWLIHTMEDSQDRLNWVRLSQARFVYFEQGNYPKLFLAETLGLLIFLVGNLGLRVIGLPFLVKSIVSKNFAVSLLAINSLLAVIPSLLFIQKGNPWNIIQFFYYSMFAMIIFSGYTLDFFNKYVKKSFVLIVVILLILSGMTTYSTLKHYFPNNAHSFISLEQLQALDFLKKQPEGVVLALPFDEESKNFYNSPLPLFTYVPNAYVSAFSSKPSFIADEMNLEILGIDYRSRVLAAKEFFRSPSSDFSRRFLKESNIRYVYSLKSQNQKLETEMLEKIFENSEVEIFRII